MKVGVPKEVKNHEDRVALTPSGVHELVRTGHQVFVETRRGGRVGDPGRGLRRGRGHDPGHRRRGVGHRRPGPEGQGADRGGVPPDAQGAGALHLPAPGRVPAVHRRAARVRDHLDRVRDGPAARRVAAAARAHVRGRRPDGAAGRGASPAERRRRPRRAHGRRVRGVRGEGGRARGRRVGDERRGHRPRHAGRGAAGGQEHRAAAIRGRDLPGAPADRRVQRLRDRAGRRSTPTWSSGRCSCPAPRRPCWSPTSSCPG